MSCAVWVGLAVSVLNAGGATLSDEIIARSLVDLGDTSRLQRVMAKAQAGEAVTVGVIGGSITQGAMASAPENKWGAITADWWRRAFPEIEVTFVNAGIGATGSDLGAHRARKDLLSEQPDIVVMEYAVNDSINPLAAETLEGLIRQTLAEPQQPAVVLFFTCADGGGSRQPEHTPVGEHYGLPMVSMRDALWPEVEAGRLAWSDFEADDVHPNDLGHAWCGQFLWALFDRVKADLPEDPAALPEIAPMPEPLVSDVFQHTAMYNADTLEPARNEGFEPTEPFQTYGPGWRAETPGSELAFTVEGEAVSLLFWRVKGPMGRAIAWVDDRDPVAMEGWFNADWGGFTPFQLVARDLGPGPHTLRIRVLDERHPESAGHEFRIHAVMTAGANAE